MAIGAWKGFKKTIKHNNKEIEVQVQETAVIEGKNIICLHCLKRFKTNSNLAVHLKCKHPENSDLPLSKPRISLTRNDRPKGVVRSVVEKLITDVTANAKGSSSVQESVIIEDDSPKKVASNRRVQSRQNKYTAAFKATVIEKMMPDVLQEHLVEEFSAPQSNISNWLKNKDQILREAAGSCRKKLTKMRRGTKYTRLYDELLIEVKKARSCGYFVNFNWIWNKARKIY